MGTTRSTGPLQGQGFGSRRGAKRAVSQDVNRREFLGSALAAAGWSALSSTPAEAKPAPAGAGGAPAEGGGSDPPGYLAAERQMQEAAAPGHLGDARARAGYALQRGWNTWSTRSVFTHVLLPDGLAIDLSFCHYGMLAVVKEAFFGESSQTATAGVHLAGVKLKPRHIRIKPGLHAYDGAYTAATLELGEVTIQVESAHDGPRGLVIRVQATRSEYRAPSLGVEVGLRWNQPGWVKLENAREMRAVLAGGNLSLHCTAEPSPDPNFVTVSPGWAFPLDQTIGLSVGQARTLSEISKVIDTARHAEQASHARYGPLAEGQAASAAALAWNTIYEPSFRRVLTSSSRQWNVARFGYAVFDWDTFFFGWLMAPDQPVLARNCVLEAFRQMVDGKFVPNIVQASGRQSTDRSQPCVGSLTVLAIHELAPDEAFLRQAWPSLLAWNRWWHQSRRNAHGLLSWGTFPLKAKNGDLAELLQPDTALGAALESGMDNSPMYDDVPFDHSSHLMKQSDVGLMSLYVTDCEALAAIAGKLGQTVEQQELLQRTGEYAQGLAQLWNASAGIFQNRRTDTGSFNPRISPTCLYPLLAGVATPEQGKTMVERYLIPQEKFGGEWTLASVPRDDPAFAEQNYWRGRVWAPLNFLVYLGLRRMGFTAPAQSLAAHSRLLFERNWRERGGVFENFSAITGQGGEVTYSDPLSPWSGLLMLIALMDAGKVALPSMLQSGALSSGTD